MSSKYKNCLNTHTLKPKNRNMNNYCKVYFIYQLKWATRYPDKWDIILYVIVLRLKLQLKSWFLLVFGPWTQIGAMPSGLSDLQFINKRLWNLFTSVIMWAKFLYLCIYLSSIYPSIYLFIHPSIYLPTYQPVYLLISYWF
jgi:hypothetical protein